MKIAIIGGGNIGGGLANAWRSKHEVTIGERGHIAEAVAPAEVVVLAVPAKAIDEVAKEAEGLWGGKIVIDCTNNVAPGMQLAYGHTTSWAEQVAAKLPGAHVFKSFNAQGAENLANPVYGGVRATNFYCGDDPAAKARVHQLVEDVGFEAVDAGGLAAARLLEPMMLLWVSASRTLGTRDHAFKQLRR